MTHSSFVLNAGAGQEKTNVSALFESVEVAWLRAFAHLKRSSELGRRNHGDPPFSEPQDIISILSHMRRQQRLTQKEIEVLCRFGELNRPPDKRVPTEWDSARLWRGALEKVVSALLERGRIADGVSASWKDKRHG